MLKNNSFLKCLVRAFIIAELNGILSAAENDVAQQGTRFTSNESSHWSPEDARPIFWPTGKAEMEYRRPPAQRREQQQQQQEKINREIFGEILPQDDQLNSLLNCQPFGHIIRLLQRAETDLKSSFPERSSSSEVYPVRINSYQENRARLWVQRLHTQMRRLYRSCLPLNSLRSILESQTRTSHNDQNHQVQRPRISTPGRKGRRKNGRNKHISEADERGRTVNGELSQPSEINSSGSAPVRGSGRANSRTFSSNRSSTIASEHHRKLASLSNELVQMVARNSTLDIIFILKRLMDLEGGHNSQQPQQMSNNGNGENLIVEIGSTVREVPPYFLSVAVGPRIIQHGLLHHVTRSKKFLTLTRGLSPAVLRMGGSAANFLTYDTTNKSTVDNSDSNSGPGSHAYGLNQEGVQDPFPQDSRLNLQSGPPSSRRPVSTVSETDVPEGRNMSAVEVLDAVQNSPKELSAESRAFSLPNDDPSSGGQEMADEEGEDDCIFDFQWHSFYKTKPNNDSTYDVLAAMFSESEGDEYIRVQDQPLDSGVNPCGYYREPGLENFTMTAQDWSRLTDFVEAAGMSLLFDINQFYRTVEGEWDPTNAKMIIQEAASRNENVFWQLGNEPNTYHFHYGFNFTGKRDAQDHHLLYKELKKVFQHPGLVGPDVTRPKHPAVALENEGLEDICKKSVRFLEEFLRHLKVNLTALSWHQYYVNGQTATVNDFTSVDVLDQLSWQIPQIVELRDKFVPNTPIWLTETSSAWGGGADGLSNRYVAGFLWLDKLGMAAKSGIDMVARQTLIYGSYALVDPHFDPYPDYWLSLLFKTLVGERVLSLHIKGATSFAGKVPPTVRLYAHCQKPSSRSYEPGNVVIYGMNLGNTTAQVSLSNVHSNHAIEQYLLEPANGLLNSRDVLLNGDVLQLTPDEELPELTPLPLPHQEFQVPSVSFGFWVITQANEKDCI